MKRFIDLRHTLEDTGVNFAWWDTVTDCFEIHCGIGGFETWEDFVGWHKGDDLERYKGLCPEWVFELKEKDELCESSPDTEQENIAIGAILYGCIYDQNDTFRLDCTGGGAREIIEMYNMNLPVPVRFRKITKNMFIISVIQTLNGSRDTVRIVFKECIRAEMPLGEQDADE